MKIDDIEGLLIHLLQIRELIFALNQVHHFKRIYFILLLIKKKKRMKQIHGISNFALNHNYEEVN